MAKLENPRNIKMGFVAFDFVMIFDLMHGSTVTDSAKPDVTRLKAALQQKFNCTLRDEHTTMLHYHINETMRYSELFTQLERLRADFPRLLEDYSVTETTLEEVFLSFAKEEPRDLPALVPV